MTIDQVRTILGKSSKSKPEDEIKLILQTSTLLKDLFFCDLLNPNKNKNDSSDRPKTGIDIAPKIE